MNLLYNISLKPYNTFGIDERADAFVVIEDVAQLPEVATVAAGKKLYMLGGGSNVLLSGPVKGLVVYNKLKGIVQQKEDDDHVWLQAQSGEMWHGFVMQAIAHGYGGVENLALIPGTVGASPIQNIGAYGVEAKETIDSVTGWHWDEQAFVTYTNAECKFGYRDSILKNDLKDKVFITSVTYKLNKVPKFNTSYGAITDQLEQMGVHELSVQAVADAVIAIRSSKLPNPAVIGNAGSFFKNPTVSKTHYEELLKLNAQIPSYPVSDTYIKVPAGWLIEQCGWKGYRKGDTGVHAKQALVLVNYGHAKGNEVWQLSEQVVQSVKERFDIALEREVQVW
jgi:UDP-N-acetylmuramate dehydrogenase